MGVELARTSEVGNTRVPFPGVPLYMPSRKLEILSGELESVNELEAVAETLKSDEIFVSVNVTSSTKVLPPTTNSKFPVAEVGFGLRLLVSWRTTALAGRAAVANRATAKAADRIVLTPVFIFNSKFSSLLTAGNVLDPPQPVNVIFLDNQCFACVSLNEVPAKQLRDDVYVILTLSGHASNTLGSNHGNHAIRCATASSGLPLPFYRHSPGRELK